MMRVWTRWIPPLALMMGATVACCGENGVRDPNSDAGDASVSPDAPDLSLDLSPIPDVSVGDGSADSTIGDARDAEPDVEPNSCNHSPIGPPLAEPRRSSFQDCTGGSTHLCDANEACDFTRYDLLCEGECEIPEQTGDQRCHRICGDGLCAEGERCESRPVYVSDTPTMTVDMCVCDGTTCPVLGPGGEERPAEGGLAHWQPEPPMPADLYYHAATVGDGYVYASGGLTIAEIAPSGNSASLDRVDAVYGSALGADDRLGDWFEAGTLPEPLVHHAMAIHRHRLYVAGGEDAEDLVADVWSAEIEADGRLGEWRGETSLPHPRGWHALLSAGDRLIVAGGSMSVQNFTAGTDAIWYADVDALGLIADWHAVSAPDRLAYSGRPAIADGRLFMVSEAGNAYSVDVDDIASPSWLVELERFDQLAATQLVGLCDSVLAVGEAGRTWIAPLGDYLGQWRLASRFYGTGVGFAVAVTPAGRVFVTGGTAGRIPIERVDAVWSSTRN